MRLLSILLEEFDDSRKGTPAMNFDIAIGIDSSGARVETREVTDLMHKLGVKGGEISRHLGQNFDDVVVKISGVKNAVASLKNELSDSQFEAQNFINVSQGRLTPRQPPRPDNRNQSLWFVGHNHIAIVLL